MQYRTSFLGILALLCFLAPAWVHAKVVVSEVMYDLEGSDSKREWVELYNDGSQAVDLTGWKINDGANHLLVAPPENGGHGSLSVPAGSYMILASDASTFVSEYGSGSYSVVDTVLSLNNTAGTITLLRADGGVEDTFSYTSDNGAAGDGNSLHRDGGNITAGASTPGSGFSGGAGEPLNATQQAGNNTPTSSGGGISVDNSEAPAKRFLSGVEAGGDRVMTVGAGAFFEAHAVDANGKELNAPIYTWNFGNGAMNEGKKVLFQYEYPGKYVVTVTARAGEDYVAEDTFVVTVKPVELIIVQANDSVIEIKNASGRDIDLSMWSLRSGNESFAFPHHTIILKGTSIPFSSLVTGLHPLIPDQVALLYPDGNVAAIKAQPAQTHIAYTAPSAAVNVPNEPVQKTSVIEEEPATKTERTESRVQSAAVLNAFDNDAQKNNALPLFALFGLLVLAVGAVLFLREKPEMSTFSEEPQKLRAKDFTITEE